MDYLLMYTPTLQEAKLLQLKGNFIPLYCEIPIDKETPVSAFNKIAYNKGKRIPYAFLLENVEYGQKESAYSFLGFEPIAILKQIKNNISFTFEGKTEVYQSEDNCFTIIEKKLKKYKQVKFDALAPFNGGAVGYASFEQIQQIEPHIKINEKNAIEVPDAFFVINDSIIAFDHKQDVIQLISHINLTDKQNLLVAYNQAVKKIETMLAKLKQPIKNISLPNFNQVTNQPINFTSNTSEQDFLQMVNKAKRYITDGDIIQVVLSRRIEADIDIEPINIHRTLRQINPSPYMFCLHYEDNFAIVGSSPELHTSCKNNKVNIHPIAGTRPRGKNKSEDEKFAKELLSDQKERAEHIMLVDLARNDIGKICEYGSVKVKKLMGIERFSHVMHIVSDIYGDLQKGIPPSKTISDTFPAGTVSGAPKIRAMEIITELEKEARGPYSGTVAYFSFNGNIDSCITIRTVILKNNKIYIQAGAGIVADSNPKSEFNETLFKSAVLVTALKKTQKWIEKNDN